MQDLSIIIDELREEMIQTLKGWIQVPSVKTAPEPGAPFGREVRRALDLVLSDAAAMGFETRNFDGYAGDVRMGPLGVDPLAIVRALWTDLKTKSLAEGGSTLTQQLAKNVYFTQEKHFARKAAELFAAVDIEKHYGKQQIFEMYVNTIYFGSGYYGIAEAAQGYFGKTPAELTSAECVLLAGLPNAPSAYSPNSSPALALKRSQVVLDRMVSAKKLTKIQAMELQDEITALPVLAPN